MSRGIELYHRPTKSELLQMIFQNKSTIIQTYPNTRKTSYNHRNSSILKTPPPPKKKKAVHVAFAYLNFEWLPAHCSLDLTQATRIASWPDPETCAKPCCPFATAKAKRTTGWSGKTGFPRSEKEPESVWLCFLGVGWFGCWLG